MKPLFLLSLILAPMAFGVELRGLSDALNQPQGRVYQAGCSAVPLR